MIRLCDYIRDIHEREKIAGWLVRHEIMQERFIQHPHCTRDDSKLSIPGLNSKNRICPPTLDRLDSGLTSPCVSDPTLTNRKIRESLPCTPSPMYAYDTGSGFGYIDGSVRVFPRFFPFVYSDNAHVIEPKVTRYNSNETIVDEDLRYMRGRIDQQAASPMRYGVQRVSPRAVRLLISPKELRRVSNSVSTPQAITESDTGSETCDTSLILSQLKSSMDGGDGKVDRNLIIDNIVELSRDQTGSRYIQQLFESKNLTPSEVHQIFVRILPHTRQMTVDQFGNYVVQKILDELNETSSSLLINQLSGNFLAYSCHMYGCRVIQRVIEISPSSRLLDIMVELRGHLIDCVEDQNANHVVQKLIERLDDSSVGLRQLVNEFLGQIPRLSMHCYGCRVVQRLVEKLGGIPDCLQLLVSEILANLWQLSQDQYGNYVVQHILIHGKPSHRSVIVQVIASHIIEFSCHKYASNIAEKALLSSHDQISRDVIIAAVMGSGGPDSPLLILMKDRFANYVIQRCLEFSHGHQRKMLIGILKANLNTLKGVVYGKHIASAIERILRESSPLSY